MATKKLGFGEFMESVEESSRGLVTALHEVFTGYGCSMEVKEAKSGYVASYLLNKKTVANYVFRKAGLIVRIYANHVGQYMDFLETLPDDMLKAVEAAPVCKRLVNPNACNPKCAMGYDFLLRGRRCQKCRISAFQFLLSPENSAAVTDFVRHELEAST